MKKLSPTRRFKMITGQDVIKTSKQFEKSQKDEESNDTTDLMDFLQYGLYLAFSGKDLKEAKKEFEEFKNTREFDTDDETLKSLMEKLKATFG